MPHETDTKMVAGWPLKAVSGGIHPRYHKSHSVGAKIAPASLPRQLILPLSQHIGAPTVPVVKIGDRVLKGQCLADSRQLVSAPIHAPTSGTVVAISPHSVPHPSGLMAQCIMIEPDGEEKWLQRTPLADYRSMPRLQIIDTIRNAGITGLGGAGFPTALKLSPKDKNSIRTLIINGVECEPYITADDKLMQERTEQIVGGIEITAHLLDPEKILIAVENNKPLAAAALRRAVEGLPITVVETPTLYPSGGEKQLVQMLLGIEIPSGQLPASVGVLCQNVGTMCAVYRAIALGEPLISRITTVTGGAVEQPRNYEVLLGTPVEHLLQRAGLKNNRLDRLIMGGPMMGFTLTDTAVPIIKSSNCIIAATKTEFPPPPPAQECIRCGLCAEVCPAQLLPQQLYWYARGREYDKLQSHHLFDCIECGACSWVCPSNIPLVQYYRAAKGEITEMRKEEHKSEISKRRFEFHQNRIDRLAAEKEKKRRLRRAEAAAKGPSDLVQAAIERAKGRQQNTDKNTAQKAAAPHPAQDTDKNTAQKAAAPHPAQDTDKNTAQKAAAPHPAQDTDKNTAQKAAASHPAQDTDKPRQ